MNDTDLRERLTDATEALHAVGPAPLPEIARRAVRRRRARRVRRVAAGTGAAVVAASLVATLWSPADRPDTGPTVADDGAVQQHGRDDEPVPMSPEQQAALRDGEVTRSEYEAGFDRFRACMEREGGDVVRVRWIDDAIRFSYEGSPKSMRAFGLCYPSEFEQVDMRWQVPHTLG
jgi:hypothetical protein